MQESREVGLFSCVARGVLVAVITSLIGVLAFSFVIKIAGLSALITKIVNQFLKALSIFLGCMFAPNPRRGLIKGGLIGIFSALIIYLLFALICSQPINTISLIVELVFSLIVGSISGIISANLKA